MKMYQARWIERGGCDRDHADHEMAIKAAGWYFVSRHVLLRSLKCINQLFNDNRSVNIAREKVDVK